MKRIHIAMITGAMLLGAGSATALELQQTVTGTAPAAIPKMGVVVDVDAGGHITNVKHAQKLSSGVETLLHETLSKWIVKPAIIDGRRAKSQMFVNVAMKTEPRADGNYDVHFDYISSKQVPKGTHSWAIVEGNLVQTHGVVNINYNPRIAPSDQIRTSVPNLPRSSQKR